MADRYSENNDYGRRNGQTRYGGMRDESDRGRDQYPRERGRRSGEYGYRAGSSDEDGYGQGSYDQDRFEDDRMNRGSYSRRGSSSSQGYGGYGGGYGQGMSGQTYGGGSQSDRYRQDDDRDYGERSGSFAQGYGQQAGYPQTPAGGYGQQRSTLGQYGMGEGGSARGQHAGKGPRNYTRSDDRIRDDINDRLTDDSHLDATEIEVKVKGGEVTLSGTVEDRMDKRRAEDLAHAVSGVKDVQNNIKVQSKSQQNQSESDEDTTASARRKLS